MAKYALLRYSDPSSYPDDPADWEAADDATAIEVAKLIGDACVEVRPIPELS